MTASPELQARQFTLRSSFVAKDFPEARLFKRAQRTQVAMAAGLLHQQRQTEAVRKGYLRLVHNRRLDGDALLRASVRHAPKPWLHAPVLLSCEDSTYARFDTDDAGPLRHAWDRGYVAHYSMAVLPGVGIPCGWLGALTWTRSDTPRRGQDHHRRDPAERESSKWSRLRSQVLEDARAAGFRGRIISLNDREGDAWVSWSEARSAHQELIARCTQNRRLVGGGKLFSSLHAQPCVARVTLSAYTRTRRGKLQRRDASCEVRWKVVQVLPPKTDLLVPQTPLELVALEVYEARPPRGTQRLHSRLLTTCAVTTAKEAVQIVLWYSDRWGVEVGNDLVKNGLELEAIPLKDAAAFRRTVAVVGPVAAQVAQWVAQSRQSPPVPVAEVFDRETLDELSAYSRYLKLPCPAVWTVKLVVATLARAAGADVRRSRPPGWRVVLRGWQAFSEFRAIRAFSSSRERQDPQDPPTPKGEAP